MTHFAADPTTPLGRQLADAGRLRPDRSAAERPEYANPMLCQREAWSQPRCLQPVVAEVRRADGLGVVNGECRDHALSSMLSTHSPEVGGPRIVRWLYECSACAAPAKDTELDGSGRCASCTP